MRREGFFPHVMTKAGGGAFIYRVTLTQASALVPMLSPTRRTMDRPATPPSSKSTARPSQNRRVITACTMYGDDDDDKGATPHDADSSVR